MKPILFNTEMVRAILAGRKTATRRKPFQMEEGYSLRAGIYLDAAKRPCALFEKKENGMMFVQYVRAPYAPGDILYVRETFFKDNTGKYHYKADGDLVFFAEDVGSGLGWQFVKWRPSIHMPKEAARLFLRVKAVRVERLQHLGIEDALKEGITPINRPGGCRCSFASDDCMEEPCSNRMAYEIERHVVPFAQLWDSTIKPADRALYGWTENPWVWVIEFERVTKEVAEDG